jgi:chromosome partitioning protein
VIDTHPGAHWTTDGAVQVADLVLVPTPPGRRELAATEGMLREHEGFATLIVPMMVPSSPPRWWIDALHTFSEQPGVYLAPPVSEHRWLRRRLLATAVTRQRHPGERTRRAAGEFQAVAERTVQLCLTQTTA